MCSLLNLFRSYPEEKGALTSVRLKHLSPCSCYFFDGVYYYLDEAGWDKILWDVLTTQPPYTKEKFDCDDFALMTKVRVAERYRINGIGVAIGNSPLGYHAWNIYIQEGAPEVGGILVALEPQTGERWKLGDRPDYSAEMILW